MEYARMTGWQTFLLIVSYSLGASFFQRPSGLIATGKQDAWMIPLWAGIFGIIVATL
ncbi:hypothetical protein [Paenibacillus sedimenti]|uniref:Uncharacterized protein n=1 Tax=Paenibacillus sedimenti TaxID=2770274 RepID=A0A926KRE1_9BACL|nr:hypothetical protein [Paenibacillus sedimenti]MBD0381918.1 hypothetical protein [Paenibacillus sedimenti]